MQNLRQNVLDDDWSCVSETETSLFTCGSKAGRFKLPHNHPGSWFQLQSIAPLNNPFKNVPTKVDTIIKSLCASTVLWHWFEKSSCVMWSAHNDVNHRCSSWSHILYWSPGTDRWNQPPRDERIIECSHFRILLLFLCGRNREVSGGCLACSFS